MSDSIRALLFIVLLSLLGVIALIGWRVLITYQAQPANAAHETTPAASKHTAEERIANYTELLAWFTLLLALVAVMQGIFLYSTDRTAEKTALAAEQSANIARDTLTASRRPWIQSSIVATEGRFRVDGAFDATFRFTFKNTGLDPAFNVMPQFRVVSGRVPNVPIDEHRRFCDEQRNIPANKHNGGYTIFPGEERAITITGPPLSHSAIETELAPERARAMEQHRPPIDVIMPVLIGCVQYQVGTNPEWHQTRFVYGILQGLEVDAAFTGMVRVPNGDGERIVGDLKLAPLAFDLGAFHAD